jgi:hypothetical protein
MTVSSRTPEGMPNRCPVCGHHLRIEPSRPTMDAPCPSCGHLLWFASERPPSDRQRRIEILLRLVTMRFGPQPDTMRVRIESLADKLFEMTLDRVFTCQSVEELVSDG